MQIRPIKTDQDHEAALRQIEMLWGAAGARRKATNSMCL